MNYKKFNNKGFTLIEIVIVVSIASVLLGFAIISSGTINRQKLSIATSTIAEDIRLTQQKALNRESDLYTYRIKFDCDNDKYSIKKGVNAYKTVNLPAGVDLVATNFDWDNNPYNGYDNDLRFNQKGEPIRITGINCGGYLSLKDKSGNFLYVIVASLTGRVRIDIKPPS